MSKWYPKEWHAIGTKDLVGHGSLASLLPNGSNLFFYLLNFLLVSTSFVVRDLCFQLLNLLGVLPIVDKEKKVVSSCVGRRLLKIERYRNRNLLAEGDFLVLLGALLSHDDRLWCRPLFGTVQYSRLFTCFGNADERYQISKVMRPFSERKKVVWDGSEDRRKRRPLVQTYGVLVVTTQKIPWCQYISTVTSRTFNFPQNNQIRTVVHAGSEHPIRKRQDRRRGCKAV